MKVKKVLVFGLSGNPPTGDGGHRGIARHFSSLIGTRGDYEEVWVMPVFQHAFAAKRNLVDFDMRIEMARLNFGDLPNVKVVSVEREVFEQKSEFVPMPRLASRRSRRNQPSSSARTHITSESGWELADNHTDWHRRRPPIPSGETRGAEPVLHGSRDRFIQRPSCWQMET